MTYLLSDPVMLLCGLATHYIMILSEMSAAQKKIVSPWEFLKQRPYKAILSVMGALLAYSMLAGQEMPPYVIFGAGYMANDALDRIGTITAKQMK